MSGDWPVPVFAWVEDLAAAARRWRVMVSVTFTPYDDEGDDPGPEPDTSTPRSREETTS